MHPTPPPHNIVVLTGAGISAESGIRTFRGSDGLWENHRIEDIATPEAFERDPTRVQRFYNERRQQLQNPGLRPNDAHRALVELENAWPGDFLLVTQNVDNLHERAGSRNLLHMHGELMKMRCVPCGAILPVTGDITPDMRCSACGTAGALRPHIVWFGEMPLEMTRIEAHLMQCDLFIAVGTSGNVYPAAGFVRIARAAGAHTIEINLEASQITGNFAEHRPGAAGIRVPELVRQLLGNP